jgi:hypothetical protein
MIKSSMYLRIYGIDLSFMLIKMSTVYIFEPFDKE